MASRKPTTVESAEYQRLLDERKRILDKLSNPHWLTTGKEDPEAERKRQLDQARRRSGLPVSTDPKINPHEVIAREKKTARLIHAIDQWVYDSLSAIPHTETVWQELSMFADVNPPSAETVRHVLVRLRERVDHGTT